MATAATNTQEHAINMDSKQQPAATAAARPRAARMYYLDWLRVFLLVFVAFNHTAMLGILKAEYLPGTDPYQAWRGNHLPTPDVYGGVAVPTPDPITYTVGRYMLSASLAYNMGLFYLRAGYFSVPSYNRKGPWKFLYDRALRLGVPLLIWEVLLYPMVLFIGMSGTQTPNSNPTSELYRQYFESFRTVGHLQMWFVSILFAFDIVYVASRLIGSAWTKVFSRLPRACSSCCTRLPVTADSQPGGSPEMKGACPQQLEPAAAASKAAVSTSNNSSSSQCSSQYFSTRFMLTTISAVIVVLTMSMFVPMIFVGMQWNTLGLTLQFSMLGQYAVCHCLGTFMYKPKAFNRLPTKFGYWSLGVGIVGYTVAYFSVAVFRTSGADIRNFLTYNPRQQVAVSEFLDDVATGELLNTNSIPWKLFDSFVTQAWAVLFSIGLLVIFRQHINAKPAKFGQTIINASYAFYIMFPLVLVSLARALETVQLHPFAFVAIVWPLTVIGGYIVGMALRAIPGSGRVL